jgi:hypothetical protein
MISFVRAGNEVRRVGLEIFKSPDLAKLEVATAVLPNEEFVHAAVSSGLRIEEVELDDVRYCIAHRDLNFYAQPVKSRSADSGSRAFYLAERNAGLRSLWLQYLPALSETSRHLHKLTVERFHGLEGNCIVEVRDSSIVLDRCSVTVMPFTVHRLKTGDTPSLALLEMRNPRGLEMTDHYYVKDWNHKL